MIDSNNHSSTIGNFQLKDVEGACLTNPDSPGPGFGEDAKGELLKACGTAHVKCTAH